MEDNEIQRTHEPKQMLALPLAVYVPLTLANLKLRVETATPPTTLDSCCMN